MAVDSQELQQTLLTLPIPEQLRLARWLLDRALESLTTSHAAPTGLLDLAGRYEGGPGDSAERIEEILEAEISPIYGLHAHGRPD